MTNLMMFENCNVEIIQNKDGTLLFELFSTGAALGYVVFGKNKNRPLPNKARILKVLQNAEITGCLHGVNTYLTESELFDFMLEAKTEKVKPFRKWVTQEVLPSINHTGSYSMKQEEPYEYFDKTFNGVPVVSTLDIAHFTGLPQTTVGWYVRKSDLICGIDFFVAEGRPLAEMKKRYPKLSTMISKMILITKSGFDKLMRANGVKVAPLPCFNTQPKQSEPINDMHNLIDNALVELNALQTVIKKLDRYNTATEQKLCKDKILKLEKSVSQKLVIIGQADMQKVTGNFLVSEIEKPKQLASNQYSFLEEPLALFYNKDGNTTAAILK